MDIIFSNHPSGSQNLRVFSHKSEGTLIEETAAYYKCFYKSFPVLLFAVSNFVRGNNEGVFLTLRDGVNKAKVL